MVSDRLQIKVNKKTDALMFMDAAGKVLTREDTENPVDIKQMEIFGVPSYEVTQRFTLKDRELLYGLGQYTKSYMDYRNQEVYMAQSNIGICILNRRHTDFQSDIPAVSVVCKISYIVFLG